MLTIKPLHSRYRVVKGDTLSKISRRNYGDDVYWVDIAHRNHMRKSLLLVGRNLILPNVHPKSHAAGSQHKVVVPFTLLPPPTSDSHTFSWFTQGISPTLATIAADVPEVSIKLKLEKTILTAELPTCKVVVKCTGEVTLTRPNPEAFTDIEMTLGDQPEIAASAKTEFQNAAADITQKGTVSWNPTSGEMEYSNKITQTTKINGRAFTTQEFEWKAPLTFIYTIQPVPVKGQLTDNLEYEGTFGISVEVTAKLNNVPAAKLVFVSADVALAGVVASHLEFARGRINVPVVAGVIATGIMLIFVGGAAVGSPVGM